MADVNLLSSAAIFYTGLTYLEIAELFDLLDVAFMSSTTFYHNQINFLIPTIQKHFNEQINTILQPSVDERRPITIMGDGR